MSTATYVLVPLFALVTIYAVLTAGRLVRAWREGDATELAYDDPEVVALEDEKQRILATLRDLDHEHSLGKLSQADHAGLKRHFESEAVRVLDRLEALRAARESALRERAEGAK